MENDNVQYVNILCRILVVIHFCEYITRIIVFIWLQ